MESDTLCVCMSCLSELTITSLFQIRVVEDEERAIPAELQRELLQAIRAVRREDLSYTGLFHLAR